MRFLIRNERGLSLVEVIASIVLLSIIIIAFLTIFPQMKITNKSTGENLDAANAAKELLVVMKEQDLGELDNDTSKSIENFDYSIDNTSNDDKLILKGQYNYMGVEKINAQVEILRSCVNNLPLREMKIAILNKNENESEIAEIYGYLPEREESKCLVN